jgi:hypothetical protein
MASTFQDVKDKRSGKLPMGRKRRRKEENNGEGTWKWSRCCERHPGWVLLHLRFKHQIAM